MKSYEETTYKLGDEDISVLCVSQYAGTVSLNFPGSFSSGRSFSIVFLPCHLPHLRGLIKALESLESQKPVQTNEKVSMALPETQGHLPERPSQGSWYEVFPHPTFPNLTQDVCEALNHEYRRRWQNGDWWAGVSVLVSKQMFTSEVAARLMFAAARAVSEEE